MPRTTRRSVSQIPSRMLRWWHAWFLCESSGTSSSGPWSKTIACVWSVHMDTCIVCSIFGRCYRVCPEALFASQPQMLTMNALLHHILLCIYLQSNHVYKHTLNFEAVIASVNSIRVQGPPKVTVSQTWKLYTSYNFANGKSLANSTKPIFHSYGVPLFALCIQGRALFEVDDAGSAPGGIVNTYEPTESKHNLYPTCWGISILYISVYIIVLILALFNNIQYTWKYIISQYG